MNKLVPLVVAGAASVALAVGGGVAIDNHYQDYQTKKQAEHDSLTQQLSKTKAQAKAESLRLNADYTNIQLECQKGQAAYALLTPVAKKAKFNNVAPVCGTPVAQ